MFSNAGDSEVDEEGNVLVVGYQDTELLNMDVEEREINVCLVIFGYHKVVFVCW